MRKAVKKNFSIIVAGPTAVGKTAVAIQLAKWLGTEIVSADSRQCYQELSIGVARPSQHELQAVPHHFIASHSILHELNAAEYADYALSCLRSVFQQHNTAVVVGGTGLYIRALTEGLDAMPEVDPAIRTSIIRQYEAFGLEWLQQQVKEKDPLYYKTGELQNPQRLMRALEVVMATGTSIRSFQRGVKARRSFESIKIGLELPRPELVARIDARVDQMMAEGLLDEVKQLAELLQSQELSRHAITALKTVGYAELFEYLEGNDSLEQAVEKIKQHTRQYAKRQMTWFRKDAEISWFHPGDLEGMTHYIGEKIK
jgi:tRNA dimethylallyltransferase